MGLFLAASAFLAVVLGVSGASSSPPALDVASFLSPLEAARMAVEDYNEGTAASAVFRLLKLRNTHKTRFAWGVHFSMNFTVKETHCQKSSSYRMGDCGYKPNGFPHESLLVESQPIQHEFVPQNTKRFLEENNNSLQMKDCSAEVSVLNFMHGSPLTSAKCQATSGRRKTKPGPRPQAMKAPNPQMDAEPYFPPSFRAPVRRAMEEK